MKFLFSAFAILSACFTQAQEVNKHLGRKIFSAHKDDTTHFVLRVIELGPIGSPNLIQVFDEAGQTEDIVLYIYDDNRTRIGYRYMDSLGIIKKEYISKYDSSSGKHVRLVFYSDELYTCGNNKPRVECEFKNGLLMFLRIYEEEDPTQVQTIEKYEYF
ncbi:MAG: hypothetical protein EOO90_23105 [Pedobacter sp.]|nr:MAG: hypothetical protein EOO90_23105 [Pedobacter sp.]